MTETRLEFEILPSIPEVLGRLHDLANDLSYTWDRRIQDLFAHIDSERWSACGHNPKIFLRRVDQARLDAATRNPIFMQDYEAAISANNTYLQQPRDARVRAVLDPERDLVAYFCAEYGLHESLPFYAGGLGVLAGDHCKAASDLRLPFVAVGLFYRAGYLRQEIDGDGQQHLHYAPIRGGDLAFAEASDDTGKPLRLHVDLLGRDVTIRAWLGRLGDIQIVLLDTDLDLNADEDRQITRELYGGGLETRLAQEIVLGMGGVRALRALGLEPTVWHINEGHAAFQVLERLRETMRGGMDFHSALEVVAAATVFTTHTPVAAGHDVFPHDLMRRYFPKLIEDIGIGEQGFFALGESPLDALGFNQTALALTEGLGVAKDPAKAIEVYQRTCDAGYKLACRNLGLMFRDGRGIPADLERAAKLLDTACTGRAPFACTNAGDLDAMRAGMGDALGSAEAHGRQMIAHYKKGCDDGDPTSCRQMGIAYLKGIGLPTSSSAAAVWLDRGCRAEDPVACRVLGAMRMQGKGVDQDTELGKKLLSRACALKDAEACTEMKAPGSGSGSAGSGSARRATAPQ